MSYLSADLISAGLQENEGKIFVPEMQVQASSFEEAILRVKDRQLKNCNIEITTLNVRTPCTSRVVSPVLVYYAPTIPYAGLQEVLLREGYVPVDPITACAVHEQYDFRFTFGTQTFWKNSEDQYEHLYFPKYDADEKLQFSLFPEYADVYLYRSVYTADIFVGNWWIICVPVSSLSSQD